MTIAVMEQAAARSVADKTFGKITLRLLPYLALLWCLAWIDRVNINFAKLTMLSDLKFGEAVYGAGAGVFFLGYFFFEVPSNLLLRQIGARKTLMRITIGWGAVSIAMMFVHTESQFYLGRFLLGAFEAGFQPGVLVFLTLWYPSNRRAQAFGLFTSATAVSTIIGAPLASYIMTSLAGVHGFAGWQWIFLIEGVATIVMGSAAWWILTEKPADATWLTADEKASVQAELDAEVSQPRTKGLKELFQVPAFWILTTIYFCLVAGYSTVNFFSTTAVKELGFNDITTIGWIISACATGGAIFQIVIGRSSDRHQEIYYHTAAAIALGAVSLGCMGLFLSAHNVVGTLACFFLAITGTASAFPVFWQMPFRWLDATAAAVGVAAINSIANLAGYFAPTFLGYMKDLTGTLAGGLVGIGCVEMIGVGLILVALKPRG